MTGATHLSYSAMQRLQSTANYECTHCFLLGDCTCRCAHICPRTHAQTDTHTHVHTIDIHCSKCVCICMPIRTYSRTCKYAHVYMQICIYTYICTYTYLHTLTYIVHINVSRERKSGKFLRSFRSTHNRNAQHGSNHVGTLILKRPERRRE